MANEHPNFEDCVQQYSLSTVRWSIEDELIQIFVLVGTRPFKELNFDACDQRSNSHFSASFLFEEHSSATDRVSGSQWDMFPWVRFYKSRRV